MNAPARDYRGGIQAFSGAALLSVSAFFAQACPDSPSSNAFYRMLFGTMLLAACARLAGERLPRGAAAFKAPFIAGVFFAGDLLCWHRSIASVGPAAATLLNNFQVVFVALALPERRCGHWMGIFAALSGLVLLLGAPHPAQPGWLAGAGWGLASAACYAASIIALKRSSEGKGPGAFTAMAALSAAGAAAALIGAAASAEPLHIASLNHFSLLLSYALITQVCGWGVIAAAMHRLSAPRAALILLIQPVLAYLWEICFIARPLSLLEAGGAVLTLIGVLRVTMLVGKKCIGGEEVE